MAASAGFGSAHEVRRASAQRPSQTHEVHERDVAFPTLGGTDVGAMQARAESQVLPGQPSRELAAAGFTAPRKLHAVYYGGSSDFACGGGAWPPSLPGRVAAEYLLGTPPGASPCAANPVGASADTPGYFDFAMLHEILHTLGFVASCAPHQTLRGHVSDSPNDLMYAGPLPWRPSQLDVGHDDYFRIDNPNCLDFANSVFLDPTGPNAVPPPGW